jgi:hypothetical protein
MVTRPITVMTRRIGGLVSVVVALCAASVGAPQVLAAPPITPFPGEVALTRAERQHVFDTMRPAERAQLGRRFENGADELVISYSRRLVDVVTVEDGREVPIDVVEPAAAPGSSLTIPDEAVAGSAIKDDLYISMTVSRTRSTAPYEWRFTMYSEWRGLDGMLPKNGAADSMAAAWAGNAYLHSQMGSGRYTCGGNLDEWPSDGAPNTGTAWSFHEFEPGLFKGCPMFWGLIDVRIRQSSLVGRTDNIVYKHYHTWGGLAYDFTFSKTPAIAISPTQEQWSLALFGSYTH